MAPHRKAEWSPLGTYLVVFTEEGFCLYGTVGAEKLELLHEFTHKKVQHVEFSWNEEYAYSYCPDSDDNFLIWDVRQERKLRTFKAGQMDGISTFQFSTDKKKTAGAYQ
jgi:uncharacterized protein with WD repeat